MTLELSKRALVDINDIFEYVADHSVVAAESVIRRIRATFNAIEQNPGIGRMRAELAPLLQSFVVPKTKYLVFYQVVDDRIEIVLHGARDLQQLFE